MFVDLYPFKGVDFELATLGCDRNMPLQLSLNPNQPIGLAVFGRGRSDWQASQRNANNLIFAAPSGTSKILMPSSFEPNYRGGGNWFSSTNFLNAGVCTNLGCTFITLSPSSNLDLGVEGTGNLPLALGQTRPIERSFNEAVEGGYDPSTGAGTQTRSSVLIKSIWELELAGANALILRHDRTEIRMNSTDVRTYAITSSASGTYNWYWVVPHFNDFNQLVVAPAPAPIIFRGTGGSGSAEGDTRTRDFERRDETDPPIAEGFVYNAISDQSTPIARGLSIVSGYSQVAEIGTQTLLISAQYPTTFVRSQIQDFEAFDVLRIAGWANPPAAPGQLISGGPPGAPTDPPNPDPIFFVSHTTGGPITELDGGVTLSQRTLNWERLNEWNNLIGRPICCVQTEEGRLVRYQGTLIGFTTNPPLPAASGTVTGGFNDPLNPPGSVNITTVTVDLQTRKAIPFDWHHARLGMARNFYTMGVLEDLPSDPQTCNLVVGAKKYLCMPAKFPPPEKGNTSQITPKPGRFQPIPS
ncbi:MAG: hypothetical protein HC857_00520 [Synechococcales cyanobacterium RU_4_20]|nr:hypothetical protein [Synechococcales cyanobacterium RU_4_20]